MTRMDSPTAADQDWQGYWGRKQKSSNKVYDVLADIYRTLILKRFLTYFVSNYLEKGGKALHAGCGSGNVDTDIRAFLDVTALDLSSNALNIYRGLHGRESKLVEGNILHLPFPAESFDVFYNLGVFEHFDETEIQAILKEGKRVLRPNGRMLVFWPPTFGFTVFILDTAHFVLNRIFRLGVQLHPPEITRIRSRKHAIETFEKAGFRVLKYYFGVKDFFTQVVIVATRPDPTRESSM